MEAAENLSVIGVSGTLWSALIDGVKWLRKALGVISLPGNFERFKLSDAEVVLAESQVFKFMFACFASMEATTSACCSINYWFL
jgi:histone demethylase JARID1